MRIHVVPVVLAGLLFGSSHLCLAQEVPLKPTPPQPTPTPEVAPAPLPLPEDCHPGHPGLKILEIEQAHPVHIIVPREMITTVTRPSLAIAYREEKHEIIEFVLKPQEITRLVPCTTMMPCQETDPHTGHCSTVMKEITELKPQKETIFVSVPEKQVLVVKVPYLKEVTEDIPQRNILLEQRTVLQNDVAVMTVPTTVYPDRYLMTPPSCPGPGCHK
jgi:hypothetical protein